MPDPASYRPSPGEVPDEPGVYRFADSDGRVIYVGKAKSLRARLSSYFQDVSALHPRTLRMVTSAARVDWTVVATEVEALQLEYSWIKEFDPRFNVKYRDDKSYPYLAVTMGEEFPRVQVMRGAKRKGTRYFGPYAHAWAIRETVDLLLRVFPVRTCSAGVFKRAGQVGRPCLLGYIDKCSAPCVGRVSALEHRMLAEDFCQFMAGETQRHLRRLESQMRASAAGLDYERAARLRDDIGALQRAMEKNAVVLPDATDADVFGLAEDDLEAAVQVFHVRGGRVRGQRGWVVEKVEDVGTPGLVLHLLQQVYGGGGPESVPREVLVPTLPDDLDDVTSWLGTLRGARVEIRTPQRGDKRSLMETVSRNATQALALHKVRRAGDLTTRSRALQEIQDALALDQAPLRIECYDASNLQGTAMVASMVVFEDGLARRSEYRRFAVRGSDGGSGGSPGPATGPPGPDARPGSVDDTAALYEVLTRRLRRLADDALASAEPTGLGDGRQQDHAPLSGRPSRPRRFAYPPNLIVVDGGPPQVAAAQRAMHDLGIDDIALCGLAKRLEEVWLPDRAHPVVLPRSSEGLYLLQRVRDEAHRFAISYHRQKRSRAMTASLLDDVPGLGDGRKAALLRHFGSVRRLRGASAAEVASVPGIGPRTAEAVVTALGAGGRARDGSPAAPRAVNTTTGEVLD